MTKEDIIIRTTSENYPKTYDIEVCLIDHERPLEFYLTGAPTANCQTFSIGGAWQFGYLEDNDDMSLLLSEMTHLIGKHQIIIDLRKHESYLYDRVIKNLAPFIEQEYIIDYENSNGSDMALYLIKLNL